MVVVREVDIVDDGSNVQRVLRVNVIPDDHAPWGSVDVGQVTVSDPDSKPVASL